MLEMRKGTVPETSKETASLSRNESVPGGHSETGPEARVGTVPETPTDAASQASTDAAPQASTDAAPQVSTDAVSKVSTDAVPAVSVDAGARVRTDIAVDVRKLAFRDRIRVPRRRPGTVGVVVSVGVLVLVLGWAVAPTLFIDSDPLIGVPSEKFRGPSAEHWFGTDNLGRDLYTRVVHAAGLSLTATVLAVAIGLVFGSLLGLASGAVGGAVDNVVMRGVDVLLSIPELLMSLALVTVLGFGTGNVALAVGVALIARFARVMRAEVLRVRRAPYVEAAYASGVRWYVVLLRHVLRNAYAPVAALAAVEFGLAVLAVSSLSFLGYGAAPPTPEWGSLISEGRNYLATAWWLTTLPGLVIVAVVLATQRLGRALAQEGQR